MEVRATSSHQLGEMIKNFTFILMLLVSCSTKSQEKKPTDEQLARLNQASRLIRSTGAADAIPILEKLLQEKSDYCEAATLLALSYEREDQLKNAIKTAKMAIQCNPVFPKNYFLLSRVYQNDGFYDSAELIMLSRLQYEKDDLDNLCTEYDELADIARLKNQHHKAIEYLDSAISRAGKLDYRTFLYRRADSYSMAGRMDEAWADIQVYSEFRPSDRRALVLKGEILQKMERHEESNVVLMEYLENPTHLGENWVHYMIGYNYNRMKEFDKSCLHLKEAARLGYEDEILDAMLEDCK